MSGHENLFDGPAGVLTEHMGRIAEFRPVTDQLPPVRHLAGYAPFIHFARRRGAHPEDLASSLPVTISFLRENATEISGEPGLADAAAVFAGNVFAAQRPDTFWRSHGAGHLTAGTIRRQYEVSSLVESLAAADDEWTDEFITRVTAWASEPPAPGEREEG
jgi:hypothetical protein